MKRVILSITVLLMMQFSLASFAVSNEASMSFAPLDNGFRITLSNVDISQVSDCTWNGISVCDQIVRGIKSGNIAFSQNGSQSTIDIPLTEFHNDVFDHTPVFTVMFMMGSALSSPVVFYADTSMNQRWVSVLRWIWQGGRWVLARFAVASASDIIATATFVKLTGTGIKMYMKKGGYKQALKDFDSLSPTNVKMSGQVKHGDINGQKVIVRPFSSKGPDNPNGSPTLEFQKNGKSTEKIRYDN
jgi:hypothetical protein